MYMYMYIYIYTLSYVGYSRISYNQASACLSWGTSECTEFPRASPALGSPTPALRGPGPQSRGCSRSTEIPQDTSGHRSPHVPL